ncbi:MAG: MaoC family dehydratase [Alphaproteobacteria bacterium]
MSDFNPAEHQLAEPHFFEDLSLGQKFPIPSRTMTDALFAAFQLASGDNHPIHYDRPYCQARGYRDMLAHGYQVLIQAAAGAGQFPALVGDALVGFIEQSSRFLAPVFAGDTLYPMLEITELTPQRTTGVVVVRATVHNQDGVLVLDGEQKYLLRKRPAESAA